MKPTDSTLELVEATAAQWVARRDAGLTAVESAELRRWLEQDDGHAAAFTRFEAIWATVGRPRRSGAAAELAREISGRQRRRRTRLVRAGAASVILLAICYLWSSRVDLGPASIESRTVLLTPESRTLPDGSVVQLKPGAEIAVDFTTALRRVKLVRGEAHFAVAKNPARPFVVDSSGIEVRAVGTAFVVAQQKDSVGLVVTEGRVSVDRIATRETAAEDSPSAPHAEVVPLAFVDAGHKVEIESAVTSSAPLRVVAISALELAERLAWRAPRAEFSGTPLGEVLAIMNRNARERFVIEDPELARVPLSGLIWLEDRAAFLKLMETGFGVYAEPRGDGAIVLRKSAR